MSRDPARGDEVWAWQEEASPGEWGVIAAFMPAMGTVMPLLHRNRSLAMGVMRPLAENHHATLGKPVRLVRLILDEVEVTL